MHYNLSLIAIKLKEVNTYHSTIKFIPDSCKTQETCDKAVNRYLLI